MASLGMALAMVALGAVYVMLHVPFLGLFQMIVYAGAVMVIVLYVIMALGQEELGPRVGKVQTALTYAAMLLLLGQLFFATIRSGAGPFPPVGKSFGSIQSFGDLLISEYAVPFEIASLLLVGAMVGAVVLSRRKWS
jgi:NADH-quinone oxidoreductase subunit J